MSPTSHLLSIPRVMWICVLEAVSFLLCLFRSVFSYLACLVWFFLFIWDFFLFCILTLLCRSFHFH